MAEPNYLSQRQFVVTVSGVAGNFMTKSGGGLSADSNKVYAGGSKTPAIVTGIPEYENITVGRAYDANRDPAIVADLREQVGRFSTSITVVETTVDYQTLATTTYNGCVLVGINVPDAESNSGDPAMMELEFAVTGASGPSV